MRSSLAAALVIGTLPAGLLLVVLFPALVAIVGLVEILALANRRRA